MWDIRIRQFIHLASINVCWQISFKLEPSNSKQKMELSIFNLI